VLALAATTEHPIAVPQIILDFDPPQSDAPGFRGDQAELVYFLSLAYAARFGAQHELSLLALSLQTDFKINLKPLLSFADREVEEPVDEDTLDLAWQDPGRLAECCQAVVAALDTADKDLDGILREYPALRDRLDDLGHIALWAAGRCVRIRVTYLMSEGA
jgi:hypothetical protein